MDDVDINDDDYLSQISGTDSEDDDVNDLNPEVPRICDLEVSHTNLLILGYYDPQAPPPMEHGLLEDDSEWDDAMEEASHWQLPKSLRQLKKNNNENLQLTKEQIRNETLCEIEQIMAEKGLSVTNIPDFPKFDMSSRISTENRLIAEELDYDCNELRKECHSLFADLCISSSPMCAKEVGTGSYRNRALLPSPLYGKTGTEVLSTSGSKRKGDARTDTFKKVKVLETDATSISDKQEKKEHWLQRVSRQQGWPQKKDSVPMPFQPQQQLESEPEQQLERLQADQSTFMDDAALGLLERLQSTLNTIFYLVQNRV
ncbi:hypothetical protein IFM89_010884 [Coptis chinensis]|uniref:Uncharacterized protein n=1 Tax=Coptis chinensis TaxID=261450 RepID=A0A835LXL3_9MAGN|nr:hypothetical protein IFM89_010884 [Coptis chinensis]